LKPAASAARKLKPKIFASPALSAQGESGPLAAFAIRIGAAISLASADRLDAESANSPGKIPWQANRPETVAISAASPAGIAKWLSISLRYSFET
jgi:hypothetical protein